jgi:hypothetical protein
MVKRYEVTLDMGERQVARLLGIERHYTKEDIGIVNQRIGPQSDVQSHTDGIAAELAFCKIVNLCPDLTIGPRSGGFDCHTRSGLTIDVKTTRYPNGKLLATLGKQLDDADIYVLMVGEFPTYSWVGWAEASELLDEANILNLGHGPTYALDQSQLHPPEIGIFQ